MRGPLIEFVFVGLLNTGLYGYSAVFGTVAVCCNPLLWQIVMLISSIVAFGFSFTDRVETLALILDNDEFRLTRLINTYIPRYRVAIPTLLLALYIAGTERTRQITAIGTYFTPGDMVNAREV